MIDLLAGIALFATVGIAGAGQPSQSPLQLRVDSSDGAVVIRLVGEARETCAVTYELEVTGQGNRSINRGAATIKPGTPVTVATVRLANSSHSDWSAKLRVDACGGSTFADEWHSGEHSAACN
jgi:hypothetical protein